MLTAQVENLSDIYEEISVLLPRHWEELALDKDTVPLSPIWETYFDAEDSGNLLMVVLRDEGKMVGYFVGFISYSLHYSTCLSCITDIFYIYPEYRQKGGGKILFEEVEATLRWRKVQRWIAGTKLHKDMSKFLNHQGFTPIEVYHSKTLK